MERIPTEMTFLFKSHYVSSRPPDIFDKNSNFASQEAGVAGLPLLNRLVCSCYCSDFGVLTKYFQTISHLDPKICNSRLKIDCTRLYLLKKYQIPFNSKLISTM